MPIRQTRRTLLPILVAATVLVTTAVDLHASSDDEGWRQDLAFMLEELEARHPDPYAVATEVEVEAAAASLHARIPSLDDDAVVVEMMRLVALLGDSHTTVPVERIDGFRAYPVRLEWLADDSLVVVDASSTWSHLVGSRLVAVDGVAVDQVTRTVSAVVPHENPYWLRARVPRHLVVPEVLRALGVIGSEESIVFRFETPTGEPVDAELTPLTARSTPSFFSRPLPADEDTPPYRRNTSRNYWYELIETTGTLYIAYNLCAEDLSQPAESFSAELGRVADGGGVERVVLDVRRNPGGSTALLQRLLADLASRGLLDRPGGVFFLVGPATFSSAMINAWDAATTTPARLYGEPTGGKPNHFGDTRLLLLPASGLEVVYSTRLFVLEEHDPVTLWPHRLVELTWPDYVEGSDPVLRRAEGPKLRRPGGRSSSGSAAR